MTKICEVSDTLTEMIQTTVSPRALIYQMWTPTTHQSDIYILLSVCVCVCKCFNPTNPSTLEAWNEHTNRHLESVSVLKLLCWLLFTRGKASISTEKCEVFFVPTLILLFSWVRCWLSGGACRRLASVDVPRPTWNERDRLGVSTFPLKSFLSLVSLCCSTSYFLLFFVFNPFLWDAQR